MAAQGSKPLKTDGRNATKSRIRVDLKYAIAISYWSIKRLFFGLSKTFLTMSMAQINSLSHRPSHTFLFSDSVLRSGQMRTNEDVIMLNHRNALTRHLHRIYAASKKFCASLSEPSGMDYSVILFVHFFNLFSSFAFIDSLSLVI